MLRREAIAVLLGACARASAAPQKGLERAIGAIPGAALLVDVETRRPIAVYGAETAGGLLALPGSTLKPFTLATLLQAGKLRAAETFPCPGRLVIGGRSLACSHPAVGAAMDARTALAYSCNCFVANFAQRFAPGELAGSLERYGLASRTGWFGETEAVGRIGSAGSTDAQRLQALGEGDVMVTAAALAMAYRKLAVSAAEPVRAGLEGAVEFGTAHLARIPGIAVAGKTGSVQTAGGAGIAWFAGFAPSRSPRVVVTVMLQGHSGGADAAPVARKVLEAYLGGKL